jgi:hypothetical protein
MINDQYTPQRHRNNHLCNGSPLPKKFTQGTQRFKDHEESFVSFVILRVLCEKKGDCYLADLERNEYTVPDTEKR